MDPLSDLLRVVRFDGAHFFPVEASGPWSVQALRATELAPRLLARSEHLISYHFLTTGRCYAGLVDGDLVELVPGDVIIFPHGDPHRVCSEPGLPGGPTLFTQTPERYPNTVKLGDGGPGDTTLFCGFLGCDRRPFNPLLAGLPRQMHVRSVWDAWPGGFTRRLVEETRAGRAGADSVLTRMAEMMFIEVLRRYLEDLPAGGTGWLAGLRDEIVGRALALIHARPAQAWTLPELAREVASSRSNLARRFTDLVGQPPMQYLTQWRLQVAASLLTRDSNKVAAIATEVGYDSEAAFSRAFRKATGMAPGAWRTSRRTATS